jgi:hypothetical protein
VAVLDNADGQSYPIRVAKQKFDDDAEPNSHLAYQSRIFHEVMDKLVELSIDIIESPPAETPTAITSDPTRSPFANYVGALDGVHLPAYIEEGEPWRPFRNCRGELTWNVFTAMDFKGRFTFILPRWEGETSDARVARDAMWRGFKALAGCYYLADISYNNHDMWLTPYRGVSYPRETKVGENKKPETKYELFNSEHSSLMSMIDRTNKVFRRRWRIYDHAPELDMDTQQKLVHALAAVHNFISIEEGEDGDHDLVNLEPAPYERKYQKQKEQKSRLHPTPPKMKLKNGMDRHREMMADELWRVYQAHN